MNIHSSALRISFRDAVARMGDRAAVRAVRADWAVLACLGVVVLSLFSTYVVVLLDAVRHGEVVRMSFEQQGRERLAALVPQRAAPATTADYVLRLAGASLVR